MRIAINRALLDLFAARRIFHQPRGGERWRVGEHLLVSPECRLEPYSMLHFGYILPERLGAFSYSNSQFPATNMTVGRYSSIGQRLELIWPPHPHEWAATSPFTYEAAPLQGMRAYVVDRSLPLPFPQHPFAAGRADLVKLEIGADVWIGNDVSIKNGLKVGDGAVIGAGAVVTRDVPPYAVVAGSPARVIRMRFPEDLVQRFLALRWWRFGPEVVQALDVREPAAFLDRLEAGSPEPLDLEPLTGAEILAVAQG